MSKSHIEIVEPTTGNSNDGKCHHASHKPEHCPFGPPDDPGKWYRRKTEEAHAWHQLHDIALVRAMPSEVIKQLAKLLEAARDVGD